MNVSHVDFDELEACAMGELGPARAAAVEDHARLCAACGDELRLLKAERALLKERAAAAPPIPDAIWKGVSARLGGAEVVSLEAARSRRRPWPFLAAIASAAAAVLVFALVRPGPVPSAPAAGDKSIAASANAAGSEDEEAVEPEVTAALDQAEGDYQKAVAALESKLSQGAAKVDDETSAGLKKVRTRLADARTLAAGDVGARMRVLSSYSAYMRSLQRAVDLEEAAP